MEYLSDGVPVYSEHDASMVEQARFMMESDSYYSPLTAMRIGNAGVWYYPLYDSLGSTRRLINGSQTVTGTDCYDASGASSCLSAGKTSREGAGWPLMPDACLAGQGDAAGEEGML